MNKNTPYQPRAIYALGSPWTNATGMALLVGGDARREVQELALTSCSAEMALEPIRNILGCMHDFHSEITNIHPALSPVKDHIKAAVSAIEEAEKCYEKWRTDRR